MPEADQSAPRQPTTIVVCVNRRFRADQPSCAARGSIAVAEALERGVDERRLPVRVERICCLGECQRGPTVRVAPGGAFFLGVSANDVPAILDSVDFDAGEAREDDGPDIASLPAPGS